MIDRPWLAHYDAGVPHEVAIPPIALPDLLANAARDAPTAPAILFYGTTIGYAELDTLATRCAAALIAAGIAPGDRVVLVLPNVPQAVICYYGALRAGATVVLTNPLHEAGSLIRQVEDAQATSIVALSMFYPLIAQVRERAPLQRVIYTNLKEHLPATQRRLFGLLRQEREGHRVPDAEARRSLWLARLLASAPADAPMPPAPAPGQPAAILYTGGTTGEAKGVLHSHRSLVANALQTGAWLPGLERGRERVLCVLPFSHVYGMTACMNFAIALAAAMILLPTFETQHVLHAIRRDRPTIFPGVPPMYAAIAEVKGARGYGISSLHACISGAAPLPVEVQEGFERITRARLVEGYGLTEAGPVTHANPLGGGRHGFMGLPLPSTEAKIVDADTGVDLPAGQIGELLVRGPQIMRGYWNRPGETAEVLTADGWLRTGDLARMSDDGFFQVIERKKEMIVAGRYNIYPRDVEEVLYEHPKVLEAAVAGVPRDGGATDVKAFVVLRRGESATAEEIIQFLRERLSAYKLPSAVEFREALPRSFIGKVLRRVLVENDHAERQDEKNA